MMNLRRYFFTALSFAVMTTSTAFAADPAVTALEKRIVALETSLANTNKTAASKYQEFSTSITGLKSGIDAVDKKAASASTTISKKLVDLTNTVNRNAARYSFTPKSCEFRPGDCVSAKKGKTFVSSTCRKDEFLLSHGTYNGSGATIVEVYLEQANHGDGPFDLNVASGVQYTFQTTVAEPNAQLCVDIVCCKLPTE